MTSPTPAGPTPGTRTFLRFESDPGDYIGQGATFECGLQDAQWSARYAEELGVHVVHITAVSRTQPPSFDWSLSLAAPKGQPLVAGTYESARRFPFQQASRPGLSFTGMTRGCGTITGRFTIDSISTAADGQVERLQASFEQNCEGISRGLRGRVSVVANPWR